ncbi:MAG: ABC transporter ATP-binding protein [Bacteroidales bacterium]|jgi:ABC-2 type transport system ATP-binding protein|nr:ABC transporter ATP-binding protein [Bacteroidales bacterium]
MSIVVKNIGKSYGKQKALDDVSFEIKSGEIVGLLGVNGAGKSTLMKILATLLPSEKGLVEINGLDVNKDVLKIRKIIGYLPENNPLYQEMYVMEYLKFIADISDVSGKNIPKLIELLSLTDSCRKKIAELSKGYKQRVGLAVALVNNPKILILDEATSGLDPVQIKDILSLIKSLAGEKTILISSHILQEINEICDRILIIDKGKLKLDKKMSEMKDLESTFLEITRQ